MLGKLLKHEFKATLRTNGLILAAGLLLMGLTALSFIPASGMTRTAALLLLLLGCIGGFLAIFICVAIRFAHHCYDREGYLTFTLPVTAGQLFFSKLISGAVYLLAAAVVLVGQIAMLIHYVGVLQKVDLFAVIGEWLPDSRVQFFIGFFIVQIVLSVLMYLVATYAAITFSSTKSFKKFSLGTALGLTLAALFLADTLTQIGTLVLPLSAKIGLLAEGGISFGLTPMVAQLVQLTQDPNLAQMTVGLGGPVVSLILIVILVPLTIRMMARKVNIN